MEVEHASPITFDNAKVIRYVPKNSDFSRLGTEETVKDRFAGIIKESGNSHRV
jgi:hypothetical protein